MQRKINDDDLAELLYSAYKEHDILFTLEEIKTTIACNPFFQEYMFDIGMIFRQGRLHIETLNEDGEWVRSKLYLLRNHLK